MSEAEKTQTMAVSAIINWWSTNQRDRSESNDSNADEDVEELAGRRQRAAHLSQTLRTRQLLVDFDGGRPILSLRAPLDLVTFPSVSCPRWPVECEVINDIIHHIEWDPPEPEPFYDHTGQDWTPMPAGEERGTVVYCTDQATKRPYFTGSRVAGSRRPTKCVTVLENQTEPPLEFESRFESGNLQKAVRVSDYDYELTLRTDMYTRKHTQWFYFRVRNMKAGVTYRFSIINFMKSSSLYSHGMRPLLYSERADRKGVGWQRAGSNIRYYRNCNPNTKDSNSDAAPSYSLTWTLQFPYDSDTCYLAHCYPYTYSHLQRYLRNISSNPAVASYCTLRVLCRSLAGNAVYVVTITSRGGGRRAGCAKKAVVVTARVHPGETNGSWMMEGFLDFLLGDSEDAQLLRDTFVFKVVPMLNPDGVIVGNYRCSLAGRDLNRNYKTSLRESFPCVWHTRNMVERLMAEMDVVLYCDFHGHNRKNNVFMYGCNNRGDASLKLQERVFPLMMSKNASNKFSFKSCKFRVQKSKEGTGRIAMWRLGIKNSYTMEATFGGSTLGDRRGTHFTTRDLKSLGFYFCDTLLDYCDPDPTKTRLCLTELTALLTKKVRERLARDLATDFSVSDLETSTSGSNSSNSDGLPAHLMNQPQAVPAERKKKRRLRSRKERNKLRPERVKNTTRPQESKLPQGDAVREVALQRPVGQHGKKGRASGPIGKASIPPTTTTNCGEVSQVTLWQGSEPVKEDGGMKAAYRATACPHVHTSTRPHVHTSGDLGMFTGDLGMFTGDLGMYTGQWRCSSQLLHLSSLLPPSPNSLHCNDPNHSCTRRSFASYDVYRGLPHSLTAPHRSPSSTYVKMFPTVVPKRLLSGFTTVSSGGLSLLTRGQLGEQNHRDLASVVLQRETRAHRNVFVPRGGTDLRGKRLSKDTLEDKRQQSVLSPVLMPSGLMKVEPPHPQRDTNGRLQVENTRQCYPGRESQRTTAVITRSSQTAPP